MSNKTTETEDTDTIFCESCEQQKPLTAECQTGGDGDLCADCMRDWRVMSAACAHAWKPYSGEYGTGRICTKCWRFEVEEETNA